MYKLSDILVKMAREIGKLKDDAKKDLKLVIDGGASYNESVIGFDVSMRGVNVPANWDWYLYIYNASGVAQEEPRHASLRISCNIKELVTDELAKQFKECVSLKLLIECAEIVPGESGPRLLDGKIIHNITLSDFYHENDTEIHGVGVLLLGSTTEYCPLDVVINLDPEE